MTTRPIIFSAPMVRAILDGRKTQTRRIIKGRKHASLFNDGWADSFVLDPGNAEWRQQEVGYAVGDRLWVREAFIGAKGYDGMPPSKWGNKPIWYCADGEFDAALWWHLSERKRASIHMPRWASRITLEVTDVRVQRLQDVSPEDAEAEGVFRHVAEYSIDKIFRDKRGEAAIGYFSGLWETLHGDGSWDLNPWVAAISFERVV